MGEDASNRPPLQTGGGGGRPGRWRWVDFAHGPPPRPPPGDGSPQDELTRAATRTAGDLLTHFGRRHPLATAAVVAVALLVGLGWYWRQQNRAREQQPTVRLPAPSPPPQPTPSPEGPAPREPSDATR